MNKNNRSFSFILLASFVMMGAILLQNKFFPPAVPNPNPDGVENELVENQEGATADNKLTDEGVEAGEENAEQQIPGEEELAQANNAKEAEDKDVEDAIDKAPDVFVTLGGLDPEGKNRFMATFNSRGATIHRVELNTRTKRGFYRYRDLETGGGFMGSLSFLDSPKGCVVRVVGPGTPAQVAGIQVGDVIKSLDGVPVVTSNEIDEILSKKKRGKEIPVELRRENQNKTVTVKLTDRPIEIIRPEPDTIDANFEFPESFLLALRKQDPASKDWPIIDERMKTGNWETRKFNDNGIPKVEFSFPISAERMKKFDLPGPVRVVKTYWLDPLTEEQQADADTRSSHVNLKIEVRNESGSAMRLGYQLDGATGTPTESWWYQMKINGSSKMFGSLAGARDIVGASVGKGHIFKPGPELVTSRKKEEDIFSYYLIAPHDEDPTANQIKSLGVDTQYFNVSLIPKNENGKQFECFSAMGWPTGSEIPEKKKLQRLVDCTFAMFVDISVPKGENYVQEFEIFCGPKEPELLTHYELDDVRAFGWFHMFSKPLCWLLKMFHYLTFQISYAIPIIMLTVLVRGIMLPLSRKAALNAQMMQALAPEMKAIKEKYKDDLEKQSQAQRDLFKRNNYNPLGGCMVGLIQLPIFIGLYRGLSVDIALRGQPLVPGLGWCSDLSAPDQLLNWQSWMPEVISGPAGWFGPYLNVLPLFAVGLFLLQTKMFTPPPTDENQAMMQKMMSFMMLFMGFIFYKMPAALCLYFIASSIWGICERAFLPKPVLDKSKLSIAGEGGLTIDADPVKKDAQQITDSKALEERKRLKKERSKKLRNRDGS